MFDIFVEYWWQYILLAICCYGVANVNYAVLFSKMFKKSDVRDYGSKNAGTTNMFRVYGLRMGTLTFICDCLKGVGCCLIARLIFGWNTPEAMTAGYIAGLFAVLGHIFPVYLRFRGGKGVATSIGAMFSLQPILACCLVLPCIAIILISDRVSVNSLFLALFFIVWSWATYGAGVGNSWAPIYIGIDAFCCTLLTILWVVVIIAHRQNLVRLFTGKEKPTGLRKALRGKSDKIVK